MTNPNYQVYNGVHHDDHQALQQQVADERVADRAGQPELHAVRMAGCSRQCRNIDQPDRRRVHQRAVSTIARYLIKLSGSYALPWNINGVRQPDRQ